ncbi:putative T7SS-secreted protein, partial [Kitasatospora sp. NPDC059327]|uniref:putative T7SS-secreted protein n=1 Tax=Kitasatospora sp. NPDC059327 TaxID=3346803 RepID=UPI0036C97CB2
MAQRPTDWTAIGLSGDPTPGDPDRMDEVQRSLADLGRVAREIDDALDAVLNKTGDGAFVGQTADALRDKISGPLRGFVQSVADAFENSARALTTYAGVVRDQQWRADNALSQGRGLAKDDSRLTELATTARQAGTAQDEAGRTAGTALSSAARGIKQPVSDCDLFWEAFQWLAIALILPALVFGGPIALIAIGVNLAIFVKTAVDFAQGKASALDLFLSGLGMIAPTTKGLPLLKLISAGAKFTWNGVKGVGQAVGNFFRGVFTGGGLHGFRFLPGLRDLARLTGSWIKSGGLWVKGAITTFPAWAGVTFRAGGLAVIQGVKSLPALVRGLPAGLGRVGTASWNFARAELGGTKWLRLLLPVDAAEIGRFGLRGALRIGFFERGVLGKFRFGAPLLGTAGRTAAAIPVPPPLHQVDALVDLPRADLAKVRLGDWAGPRGLDLPHLEPGGLGLSFSRPATFGLHPGLTDQLSLAPHAVRQLDALLDMPVRELHSVRMGDWGNLTVTPGGLHLDAGLGVSAHPGGLGTVAGAHAGTPGGLHLPGTLGTVQPAAVHLADTTTATGTGAVHLPSLQTQAIGLHQPATGTGTIGTGALHTATPQVPAVHTADLLAPGTQLHPAPVLQHGGGLTPGVTPGLTSGAAVPGLGAIGTPGAQLHGALDLLATGSPLNRADAPVFGTGGHLGEHSRDALTAHQVNLHLSEFSPPRVAVGPPAVLPVVHTVTPPAAGAFGRVDDALGLLDPGGLSRVQPPTALVQTPGVHAPTTPTQALPTPATHTPAPHTPAPVGPAAVHSPTGTGLPHGIGPERPTGAQLDRLWREQSDRVVALFGPADDPGRAARLDAWGDLTLARHEFGRAERLLGDLNARPGSGSRPSPVVIHAQASVDAAARRLDDSLDRLAALGVDPARMDQDLARLTADSLRERPRLLGGAETGGGVPPTHAQPQPAPPHVQAQPHVQPNQLVPQPQPAPPPVVLTLTDGGPAGPNGWRIETTTTPGGPVHRVLDAHGTADPLLHPTARPGGGFDVRNTHLGGVQSYDGTGRLVAEDMPLTGPDGAPVGHHVHTDFDGQGHPTHQVRDVNGVVALHADPRPGGGFDLRDPATGGHRGYDHAGQFVEEGRPLLVAGGAPLGPVLLLGHDNGVITRSLGAAGGHDLTVLNGGAGLRVTHPVTGRSVRFDADGGFRGESLALGDGAGLRGARFVTPQGGGHVLTDLAGARLPQPVTTLP